MKLKIKKIVPHAVIPAYASAGAASFDLTAIDVPDGGHSMSHGGSHIFRTGLAFAVPPGWAMEIHSRSGHGFKSDLRLANCTGIIDSDYRGEVMVKLTADGAVVHIQNGERIAQARLVASPQVELELVDELDVTARGAEGFGSTGSGVAVK